MAVKLEDLIEKIKQEGIDEAEKQSKEIIDKAGQEAERTIAEARDRAGQIRLKGEKDAAQFKSTAEAALRQAGRDLVLNIREQLIGLCDSLFRKQLSEALTPETIKDMLVKIADKWVREEAVPLEVIVSEPDRAKVRELIMAGLKAKADQTIEISASPAIEKGFRITRKGEDIYYDFTDESIAEALKELVNPVLAALLDSK